MDSLSKFPTTDDSTCTASSTDQTLPLGNSCGTWYREPVSTGYLCLVLKLPSCHLIHAQSRRSLAGSKHACLRKVKSQLTPSPHLGRFARQGRGAVQDTLFGTAKRAHNGTDGKGFSGEGEGLSTEATGHETPTRTITRWAVQKTCSDQSELPQLRRCSIAGCSATRGLCTNTPVILESGSCGSNFRVSKYRKSSSRPRAPPNGTNALYLLPAAEISVATENKKRTSSNCNFWLSTQAASSPSRKCLCWECVCLSLTGTEMSEG